MATRRRTTEPLMPTIKQRSSGILLHISSLPGPYGIGDLGGAPAFVDFLAAGGQTYWQILPLGPTSPVFGNSPYMSFSAFAGNPLLISPQLLLQQGLLDAGDVSPRDLSFSDYFVEFDRVIKWKQEILAKAWQRFKVDPDQADFVEFCSRQTWLDDYALFMALKCKFNYAPWYRWPRDLRDRNPDSLRLAAVESADRLGYYRFEQFHFFSQWRRLRNNANRRGIRLIGDLPINVGLDSVDVWANRDIFQLNPKNGSPTHVAGVPPDYFSATGQRWGNPLYRWNSRKPEIKERLYRWWARRLATTFSLVDVIRIDHFRGFEAYWSIPSRDKTAEHGSWQKGPGVSFFREMERRLGRLPVIAEDLGVITPAVERLRDRLRYPGMKILLFGFDGKSENPYLPFNYTKNCVVYTGTHDNDTAVGWFLSPDVPPESKLQAKKCANKNDNDVASFHRDLIYLALSSIAVLAMLPMQDVLGFGNDCRMNTPATTRGNWQWRCAPGLFSPELSGWLHEQNRFFGRLPASGP